MIDSARLWIGLLVGAAVVLGAVATRRFIATGERPLAPLAGAATAFAGVFALGEAAGYFRPARASVMTVLSLFVAVGLAVQWYRKQ
ncbi:hypothetical protein [Halolamina salifodinae]|uniref:Uncharacterized protein n=1 Tax=Halolamina salifodinae TaxID=1202767 RepID=A0A8T4GZT2_9EURY|nr:hypothetical protein [Halolamina salifodinae]MBP1987812.1 hypothetical protein [Halolamina salifodinae]